MTQSPVRPEESTDSGLNDLIYLGKFTKPHGLRGQIRFLPEFEPVGLFEGLNTDTLLVKTLKAGVDAPTGKVPALEGSAVPKSGWFSVVISDWFFHQKFLILALKGLDDIDHVEPLRDYEVYVRAADLWDLPKGHYFHYQLIGMEVVDADTGVPIGTVRSVQTGASHDFLEVAPPGKKPYLVPFREPVLQSVEQATRTIKMSLPPGLDEL